MSAWNAQEAAELIGVSEVTLARWRKHYPHSGDAPVFTVDAGKYYYPEDELYTWLLARDARRRGQRPEALEEELEARWGAGNALYEYANAAGWEGYAREDSAGVGC